MINLLPPQYKQALKKEENFRLVLIFGLVVLTFFISLALILFSVRIYVQAQAESVKFLVEAERVRLQSAQTAELREKITRGSQNISKLSSFYKNRSDSTEILETIFQIVPEQISLTSMSWRKETGVVAISGFSPSREVLFGLRNNLQAESKFSEINFPPQNFVKAQNIDFQATFKVSP